MTIQKNTDKKIDKKKSNINILHEPAHSIDSVLGGVL